ncbi:MAG: DUF948 domain-containing protein [Nitrospirota bacterium]
MTNIWLVLMTIAVLVAVGFLIPVLLELKKTARSTTIFLKTAEESLKPTMEELQQTLKSLRNITENINNITVDVKEFSGAVKEAGQNIKTLSLLIGSFTSAAAIKTSGLRVGIRTALQVLLSNLFSKKEEGK